MASELVEQIRSAPLPTPEHLFGKGTLMPFNCTIHEGGINHGK